MSGLKLTPVERKLLQWRNDPVAFVREALHAEPDEWQMAVLVDLRDNDRIAVRSGHGVGKTTLLAWIILWWLLTRTPALVACTSPSSSQLENVLWAEIARWRRKMIPELQALLNVTSDKVTLAQAPDENFAVARTARKENPEALQGFHSQNMLFLIDEASGVEEIIFEVGEGSMSTPGAKTLMTGNPTRTSGQFYRAFHEDRESWATHHVSLLDMIARGAPHVNPKYPESVARRYGEESNVYRVRVLGDFPTSEDDVVIPLHLVEAAVGREVGPTGRHVWGVDPARYGDDRTALSKRFGNVVRERSQVWRQKDTQQVAGLIKLEYTDAKWKPDEICVDVIGIGAGVYDRLKEEGLPVRAVNVAESPSVKDRYMRLRDELWFKGKEWFEDRACSIVDDQTLISELTAVKYDITGAGKIKVESKDEMKARGLRSPDVADAFLLTFAAREKTSNFWKPIQYQDAAYYV